MLYYMFIISSSIFCKMIPYSLVEARKYCIRVQCSELSHKEGTTEWARSKFSLPLATSDYHPPLLPLLKFKHPPCCYYRSHENGNYEFRVTSGGMRYISNFTIYSETKKLQVTKPTIYVYSETKKLQVTKPTIYVYSETKKLQFQTNKGQPTVTEPDIR
jgi:hypothetical protein